MNNIPILNQSIITYVIRLSQCGFFRFYRAQRYSTHILHTKIYVHDKVFRVKNTYILMKSFLYLEYRSILYLASERELRTDQDD